MDANQKRITAEYRIKLFSVLLILVSLIITVLFVKNLLVSLIFAFVINYLLNPITNSLERDGISRRFATLIPFILIGILSVVIVQILSPIAMNQFNSLRSDLPKYIEGTTRLFAEIDGKIDALFLSRYSLNISQQAESYLISWSTAFFEELPRLISNSLTTLILAPILAFFMILDGRNMVRRFLEIIPNNYFELALNLNHQINVQIGGFIRARILEAAIVGFVVWVGLAMIGFPNSLLLAFFAALMNLIPYIGPFIGAIPAIAIALINGLSGIELVFLCSIYTIAQIIDVVLIIPLVVAKIVNLHPVVVLVVIIIGAQIMGVLGMIISIPVASAIKVTISAIYNHLTDFRI